MERFRYDGKTNCFVSNGDIITGNITTWSVKNVNSDSRENVNVVYKKSAGFNGEDIPISINQLKKID